MTVTAYDLAQRWIGTREVAGAAANPFILGMLRLDQKFPTDDAVPWCSAFANFIAWQLRLPRSKSLRARSWLHVGIPIPLADAAPGYDVVILQRGDGPQPGPAESNAPGHVGFFAAVEGDHVLVLGGNQGNAITIDRFPAARVLGVRRLV
jgi:uncharacterized protein (TIGR02594 family)